MAFWLRYEERRVAARARRVERDLAETADARSRLVRHVNRDLARPKVLLGLFAAGFGFGWLRRNDTTSGRPSAKDDDDSVRPGRLASVFAAALAGARIYDQVRRAAAVIASSSTGSVPPAQHPPDPAQQHEADERYDPRQEQLP